MAAKQKLTGDGFICVVCQREADDVFRHSPKDRHVPPLCKNCEEITGYSWTGDARRRTAITSGTFMDRRKAFQIAALADALDAEAQRIRWRLNHAAA